ncbi:MAG: glycoside hydrolase family 2 protein [Deferribacteres bacterium]|nr:glycoside hydrolase family 2 protein [Deferribacteres bacterium]
MDTTKKYLHSGWEYAFCEHESVHTPSNFSDLIFRPAKVPGSNLSDLQKDGFVEKDTSPDYESSFSPYKRKDFIYRTTFSSGGVSDKKQVYLCFDGLDTVCEIFLNGKKLASIQNCHVRYRFPIKELIRDASNELTLVFRSPTLESQKRQKAYPVRFPTHLDIDYMYLRKPAYSFFWDWGPQIPVSGVFRPVYLHAFDDACIDDYQIRYQVLPDKVVGTVKIHTTTIEQAEVLLNVGEISFSKTFSGTECTVEFEIPNALLWYPNGAGEPYLYDLQLTLNKHGVLDKKTQRIGFRKIEISQEKRTDGKGTRFLFNVNEEPILCRGYNWIPFDNDVPRGGDAYYREYIELAQKNNVNMLRIWGGGFYEDDEFYRQCDEKGIMVWQDGMFACTLYPDDQPEFMREVKAELTDNIKRLRNYTSLVLWCGENECHQAYHQWWADRHEEFPRFYGEKIYHELYPNLVKKYDPDRFYWPGSPYSEGKNKDFNDLFSGDSHPWLLFINTMDFTNYRADVPSFVSENGIQSFPDLRTTLSIGEQEDRHFQSYVFDTRNHFESPAKNERLLKFIAALFRFEMDFENLVYLSNLAQAEYLKYAIEHWRSHAYDFGGVLIWQFNDCWPAISWSAVDYNRLPKALYYYMTRTYANDLVGFKQNFDINFDPEVEQHGTLFVASEHKGKCTGELEWQVVKFDGSVQSKGSVAVAMPGSGAKIIQDFTVPDYKKRRFDSVLHLQVKWDDGRSAENLYTLSRPKHMHFQKPAFSISQLTPTSISIEIDTFAKGIYIFHPDKRVTFDDNYFDLMPGIVKEITASVSISTGDLQVFSYYH